MSRDGYSSPSFDRTNDRDGFQPLNNRGDAAIDIPLQTLNGHDDTSYKPSRIMSNGDREKESFSKRKGGIRKSVALSRGGSGLDNDEDKVTAAGRIYDQILNFSTLTKYFIYILPVAAVISIPIIIGATAAKGAYMGGVRMLWVFVWVLCSWVGLWASKMFAHYLPMVFQAVCGVVNANTRKYFLILKNLEIPVSLFGWALVTLATFKPLMTGNPGARASDAPTPQWVNVVQQVLAAALISAGVFLGERLFIQIITINYHRKQFYTRIKEHKRTSFLLGLMYEASTHMFRSFCPEFAEEDAIINDTIDLTFGRKKKKVGHFHHRSGSSTPGRVLHEVGALGDKVTAAFGSVAAEVTGKQVVTANTPAAIVNKALEKNSSSEALARRVWLSFVIEGNDSLYLDDIIDVLGAARKTEAEECFALLDQDGNGDVSLDEMIMTVTQFGRDKSAVAASLHDVDQAIKVLDRMLCVVLFIVVVFIFIAFLNASFVTTLATAGTALLSLSFVFSVTAQEILGSCIFLFVKHPFDIGDRVDLNLGNDKLIVEHISLLFTVFRRVDSRRTVQIPNIVLNTLWIENVSRSSAMKEIISIFTHVDTTLADLQLLKNEMKKFVTDKENCRDFQEDIDVEILGVHEMDKLEVSIEIRHKSNWSNETVRAARRSKFMCALVLAIRKVPIYGPGGGGKVLGSHENPAYSVHVSNDIAARVRDEVAKAKEEARLVPTAAAVPSPLADTLGSPTELKVMTSLNERSPAIDGARDVGSSRANNSPTSPRGLDSIKKIDEEDELLLRRSTTKGRRKGRDMTGMGLGEPMMTTGAGMPNIGVTAPSPSLPSQGDGSYATREESNSDEDWYGRDEDRPQDQQVSLVAPPAPPPAAHQYAPVPLRPQGSAQWRP